MNILSVRPLADSAVTLSLADAVGEHAAAKVGAAVKAIRAAIERGELLGATEVAGAFCSVTVHYDCLTVSQGDLVARLQGLLASTEPLSAGTGRLWTLPCLYGGEAGIDLPELAGRLGLPEAEIVARHAAVEFRVYALGFLPGLPFLGDLPADLALPRRSEPRTRVPPGSVAVANLMCVIYPWASPGGWHILGCCPVPLFDVARRHPSLLAPGDRVRFAPVTPERFAELRAAALEGHLDLATLSGD